MITIYKTLLLSLLMMTVTICLGQQSEKVLVKSFNLQGNQLVTLDLDGPVEVQSWSSDILRIQMTISLENGSEAMLKSLVQAGRYNLTGTEGDLSFDIVLPGLERDVVFRGTKLEEKLSFIIFAPERVTVKMSNEVTGATPDDSSL